MSGLKSALKLLLWALAGLIVTSAILFALDAYLTRRGEDIDPVAPFRSAWNWIRTKVERIKPENLGKT